MQFLCWFVDDGVADLCPHEILVIANQNKLNPTWLLVVTTFVSEEWNYCKRFDDGPLRCSQLRRTALLRCSAGSVMRMGKRPTDNQSTTYSLRLHVIVASMLNCYVVWLSLHLFLCNSRLGIED